MFRTRLKSRNSRLSFRSHILVYFPSIFYGECKLLPVPANIYYIALCMRRDEVLVERQPSRGAPIVIGRPSVKFETAPAFRHFTSRNIADLITRGSENSRNGHRVCGQRLSTSNGRVFVLPSAIKTATGSNLREEDDRLQTQITTGRSIVIQNNNFAIFENRDN